MCFLAVDKVSKCSIRFPVNLKVREGEASVFFFLHGRAYVRVLTVQVEEERTRSVRPDDEGVSIKSEPKGRYVGCIAQDPFFKFVFHVHGEILLN